MKLLFYIHALSGGGAERVLANLTNELVNRGYDITIALNDNVIVYDINPKVKILSAPAHLWYQGRNIIRRVIRNIVLNRFHYRFVKDSIKTVRPDIIITFIQCNIKEILRCHGSIPIILSEHNAFDRKLGLKNHINRFFLSRFFNIVCVLTPFDKGFASGRVDAWQVKGFDIAIKAFAEISNQYPDVELNIAGSGNNESIKHLEQIANRCGVVNKVHFLGRRDDIQELMRQHRLFVLSSRTEGFPMVLIEAMSQGLPCVSFERLATSIINDKIDGLLVEDGDTKELSAAIAKLLADSRLCYQLGVESIKNVGRFSSGNIADKI